MPLPQGGGDFAGCCPAVTPSSFPLPSCIYNIRQTPLSRAPYLCALSFYHYIRTFTCFRPSILELHLFFSLFFAFFPALYPFSIPFPFFLCFSLASILPCRFPSFHLISPPSRHHLFINFLPCFPFFSSAHPSIGPIPFPLPYFLSALSFLPVFPSLRLPFFPSFAPPPSSSQDFS